MRIKKRFLFDEEQEAERIIAQGFQNNKIDYKEMYLVAKYFREKYNLGAIRLENKLIEFCKQYDKNFNPIANREAISKWINSAINYKLRKIEKIDISKKEIEILKKIEYNRDRKLLFMTLLFSKALKVGNTRRNTPTYKPSNNYYIRYGNFKDIIEMSELANISETKFAKILNKYKHMFIFYTPEKELIKLEFVDKKPKNTISITNLDSPLESYQEIFGKNMTYCEICGTEIFKRSRNQKYCKDCAHKIRNEKQKKLMRERRN